MADPRDLQLSSYDYQLPEERIAQSPVEPRHAARLLSVPALEDSIERAGHLQVWDWHEQLQAGSGSERRRGNPILAGHRAKAVPVCVRATGVLSPGTLTSHVGLVKKKYTIAQDYKN